MPERIPVNDVITATENTFLNAGLAPHLAAAVAKALVHADMMGHYTHGIALVPHYLGEIEHQGMATSGQPTVTRDDGATQLVEGNRLPGGWLLSEVIDWLIQRSERFGTVSASISNCFHIGALQVYLPAACDKGLMCFLTATDPNIRSLAPPPRRRSRHHVKPGRLRNSDTE